MSNQIVIDRMNPNEAEPVALLFENILLGLSYYNDDARKSEVAKYSANRLRQFAFWGRNAILVARDDKKSWATVLAIRMTDSFGLPGLGFIRSIDDRELDRRCLKSSKKLLALSLTRYGATAERQTKNR